MIKQLIKKIIYREKASSESYVCWLREKGAKIGDRVKIFAPSKTTIDITRPWLLEESVMMFKLQKGLQF